MKLTDRSSGTLRRRLCRLARRNSRLVHPKEIPMLIDYSRIIAFCVPVVACSWLASPVSGEDSQWTVLFDGSSTDAWREYNQDTLTSGWVVRDGTLTVLAEEDEPAPPADQKSNRRKRQDIITKDKFAAFELELEFRVTESANSGVMYHVLETDGPPYKTGPEIQIQDNSAGHDPQKAGWLYQLYAADVDATKPTGQWNSLRIVITPESCTHELNGVAYVQYVKGSGDWDAKVAASKFSKWEGFGKATSGHICLQDHGDEVSYRNIRIKRLD